MRWLKLLRRPATTVAPTDRLEASLRPTDLASLTDVLTQQLGLQAAVVDGAGTRVLPARPETNIERFLALVDEDPVAALAEVAGPPVRTARGPISPKVRSRIEAVIVSATLDAVRRDPARAAAHLDRGLAGVPSNLKLWLAQLEVAGSTGSVLEVELVYESARQTFATGRPEPVPEALTMAYLNWLLELAV